MNGEYGAYLPVPYWDWAEHHQQVAATLANNATTDEVKYAWPILKDLLDQCQCVVSGVGLEISPYLPPLHVFGSYDKALHRTFMSATVTDDAFLVKAFGLSEEA